MSQLAQAVERAVREMRASAKRRTKEHRMDDTTADNDLPAGDTAETDGAAQGMPADAMQPGAQDGDDMAKKKVGRPRKKQADTAKATKAPRARKVKAADPASVKASRAAGATVFVSTTCALLAKAFRAAKAADAFTEAELPEVQRILDRVK